MSAMGRCTGLRRAMGRRCEWWFCGAGAGNGMDADGGGRHVYASFGGLLLHIEGPHKRLSSLRHEYIYLLMKK